MKTIRLIVMFFIICMLGACTAEELAGPESGVEDDAPVVIAISPADITSVNMNSRAAGDNSIFSVIDDVNVKVNYGGNTVIVYLVKMGIRSKFPVVWRMVVQRSFLLKQQMEKYISTSMPNKVTRL